MTATEATGLQGFDAFYVEEWADLLGFAAGLCRDLSLAEELTQEAMTRVFARWPLLREPRPYAFRVVRNLVTDHARRRRRETAGVEVDGVAAALGVDPHLLDAVQRLAPRHAEVLLLHYLADLPIAEVAQVLRRPYGTVGRQLAEARAALSDALGGEA